MKNQKLKMKNQKLLIIIFLVSLLSFLFPFQTQAGLVPCGLSKDDPDQPGDQTVSCQFCHLFVLFKNIVDFVLFTLVPPLAIFMIVIAGAMYMLAYLEVIGEGPKWISQAKSLLWGVVWGLIIIYGAWLIVNLFFQIIGVQTWTGLENWWQIDCPVP